MRLKSIARLAVLLFTCVGAALASAQGCPPGQYPVTGQGWNYCAPVPGSNQDAQPAPPTQAWKSRWQSIATDATKGALGTSVGQATASLAERAALADCRAKGGDACKVQITNGNGCVAMITGEKFLNTKSGATKAEAERSGLSLCNSEDTNCRVYYSACSLPEKVP